MFSSFANYSGSTVQYLKGLRPSWCNKARDPCSAMPYRTSTFHNNEDERSAHILVGSEPNVSPPGRWSSIVVYVKGRRPGLIEAQGGAPRPTDVERNPGYKRYPKHCAL